MFDIDFVQDLTRDVRDGILSRYGYITSGTFSEEFVYSGPLCQDAETGAKS